jgi:HAD superfamily hydrolase (TIGR01549 family)
LAGYHNVTAVLFDLDGTLRHSRPSFNQAFFDAAHQLGLPDGRESRKRAMRWLHYYWAQSPEMLADRARYPDERQFWTNHARLNLIAYGCAGEHAEGLAAQVYAYLRDQFQPEDWVYPYVPALLARLRASGLRLGVLSNRTNPCQEDLERLGLAEYFEMAVVAGEFGAWKPDPEIFQQALTRLGNPAHETLYVGDNYYADVIGAENAGLVPVLLDPDGLFPEANCQVIARLEELPAILERNQPA